MYICNSLTIRPCYALKFEEILFCNLITNNNICQFIRIRTNAYRYKLCTIQI